MNDSKTLELKVGLFVLVGLLVAGGMVVQLGRFGETLRPRYELTLEFPNASGLLRSSKVLLAGAVVGTVTSLPRVLDHARGVSFQVKIFQNIRIPKNANVVVGSSGLLGDRFVDIQLKPEDPGVYFQPGDTIRGTRMAGMEDMMQEGGKLLTDLRGAVANLNGMITRVNKDLLRQDTFDKLHASMANLETATQSFRESSDKIGALVGDARGAVADARTTLASGKEALETAQKAAEDLRAAIADTRKVLASTKRTVDEITRGSGLLGTLITDRALADNLNALISNLRRSGVLFYKDRPASAPEPAPTPPRNPPARHRR